MKGKLIKEHKKLLVCLTVVFFMLMEGCKGNQHEWIPATCTNAASCTHCGMTQGEALGHDWIESNCTEPKKCSRCLITSGEALEHDWEEATCINAKTCTRCGKAEGDLKEHEWTVATCDTAKTCMFCGKKEGEALGHIFNEYIDTIESTCCKYVRKEAVCERCGEVDIKNEVPTGLHEFGDWKVIEVSTCTQDGLEERSCKSCNAIEQRIIEKKGHIDDKKWVSVRKESPESVATHCLTCGMELNFKNDASVKVETNAKSNTNTEKKNTKGVDKELKAFLDSYEAFIDKYVDFMKKYTNSTMSGDYGTLLAMLSDYNDIMDQLEDFERKADAYDSTGMSKEDYAYYLDSLNRIQHKMLEVYQFYN